MRVVEEVKGNETDKDLVVLKTLDDFRDTNAWTRTNRHFYESEVSKECPLLYGKAEPWRR